MKFLVLLFSFICVAQASFGGYEPQSTVSDDVREIAKWAAKSLAEYTNVAGEYIAVRIENLRTQIVAGTNYKFTLYVGILTPDNKHFVRINL